MEALGSHPRIEVGFEEFGSRVHQGAEEQLRFARSFFSDDARGGAKGFKTKIRDIADPTGFASLMRDLRAHVIVLQRRNVVKSVVSWYRAEVVNSSTGDWNLYEGQARPAPISIDPARFTNRLRQYEEARERLQRFALELELTTLFLYYEDMLIDPNATFRVASTFLGVEPLELQGRSVKATSDDLREAISNFDELRAVAGDMYHPMFDEVLVV